MGETGFVWRKRICRILKRHRLDSSLGVPPWFMAHSTLQINAIHYLPNRVPKSHQLPLSMNQNFKVLVANRSSFIPNKNENYCRSP